jgi:hypothetical protein
MEALEQPAVAEKAIRVLVTQMEKRPGLQPHWPAVAESLSSATVITAVSGALSKLTGEGPPPSNKGLQLATDSYAFLNSVAFWRQGSAAWR